MPFSRSRILPTAGFRFGRTLQAQCDDSHGVVPEDSGIIPTGRKHTGCAHACARDDVDSGRQTGTG